MVAKWPTRLPELRTTSRLYLHGGMVIPACPTNHFLAKLYRGVL